MHVLTLAYHDVIEGDDPDASGRPGPTAATFKVGLHEFRRHVAAIARARGAPPLTALDLPGRPATGGGWLITFDDGGASAHRPVADVLDEAGWAGHFLIITDRIGHSGFLTRDQIRELRRRGHVVGSHSCSHPTRMAACSWARLLDEWRRSVQVLSELLEEPVTVASVPGGYYSRRVAEAAAQTGIRVLFTSEPTTRCFYVDGCLVLGRYSIRRATRAEGVAALAEGRPLPRLRRWASWEAKKLAKSVGGDAYLKIRASVLR